MDAILQEIERIEAAKAFAREMFPKLHFPNIAREPVFFGRQGKTPANGKVAIVDVDRDAMYAIASRDYNLILHEEVIKQVHDACKELPEFGKPELKVKLPYEGAKLVCEVHFPDMVAEVKPGDGIIPRITVRSSYDLQWKVRAEGGLWRLICSNGAAIPVQGKTFQYINRHISTLDMSVMIETMKAGLVAFSEETGLWKQWAEKQITAETYDNIWEALPFSEAERKKMEELPEAGTQMLMLDALAGNELSLWDMHNVVTQFVTHAVQSENRKADLEPAVASVFNAVKLN